MSNSRYQMKMDLNILNHLGLNLYGSTPSVLAEVIANAWDADATEVSVEFDISNLEITISDNGIGMSLDDINDKYLLVGYQKRKGSSDYRTRGGRKPMGRKGIGKLSLLSIADNIYVYSKKSDTREEALLLDADEIRKKMENRESKITNTYEPTELKDKFGIETSGTVIKINKLKRIRLTRASINGLRKKIARRFSILEDAIGKFDVIIDGKSVGLLDRDYFDKARYLFQYGSHDYSEYCSRLDTEVNSEDKIIRTKDGIFNEKGEKDVNGKYKISGWVAIAHHTNDLDDMEFQGEYGENLNKVSVVVRGKLAEENILQENRSASYSPQYMFGEIIADFLDEDTKEDIATTDRQGFQEDDERYKALLLFLKNELMAIGIETDKLKERAGLNEAASILPSITNWYESLSPDHADAAKRLFGKISQLPIDDEEAKKKLFIGSIFTFENLRFRNILYKLNGISAQSIHTLGELFDQLEDLEATTYYQTVKRRVEVIDKLVELLSNNAYEFVIRDHLYDHPWLLNPAWEEAALVSLREKGPSSVIDENEVARKFKREIKGNLSSEQWNSRFDLYYSSPGNKHVIIELKRAEVGLDTSILLKQISKYSSAMRKILSNLTSVSKEFEIICVLDTELADWEDSESIKKSKDALEAYEAIVVMYSDLVLRAKEKYSEYYTARRDASRIHDFISSIEQSDVNEIW